MDEEDFNLAALISGYIFCTLTIEEEHKLMLLLEQDKEKYKLLEQYRNAEQIQDRLEYMEELDVDRGWIEVNSRLKKRKAPSLSRRFSFLKYAAVLLSIVGIALVYFKDNRADIKIVPDLSRKYKNDVLPGSSNARLILSDGKEVQLNMEKHLISAENGVSIVSGEGKLKYEDSKSIPQGEVKYNRLIVPAAGTYSLELPDGTHAVLNAMSELKFPVHFNGAERIVELQGEGYFEVAKDAKHPFKVKLRESVVEVLGTKFNINSYGQIAAKTTLLEGSVKVSNGQETGLLVPGKQSIADKIGIRISAGDIAKAMAWKNGEFYFNNDEIGSALQEVARWYDLRVIYRKPLSNIRIGGQIRRNAKLSEVLDMLKEVSNLSFTIDQKTLIVN